MEFISEFSPYCFKFTERKQHMISISNYLYQLMFRSPLTKIAASVLQIKINSSFCINHGLLDPSKHIYMNHVPQNVYLDYWPIGHYPELILVGSIPPATYQPQVQKIIVQALNTRYNVNLTEADVLDQRWDQLFSNTIKTEQEKSEFFDALYQKLATKIFVKESRWTWIKEQEYRLNLVHNMMKNSEIQTVQDFLLAYNAAIERLVSISHFGLSGSIEQSESPQQKQFFNEINDVPVGIADLKVSRPENQRFINKLMRFIHAG